MTQAVTLHNVFVYGTLKPGHGNYRVATMAGQHQHQPAQLSGFTLHTLGAFPGIKRADPWDTVKGVVLTFTDIEKALPVLDKLEGVSWGMYQRERVNVQLDNGTALQCWTYIYGNPSALTRDNLIETGEWTK